MNKNDSTSTSAAARLPRCPTGIRGLDEITGGGLPRGRPTLVCGGAGCGKTLLGVIGFSGEFVGSMVLSFKNATAVAIVSNFTGMPIEPGSPDFADAVGELANMIAGSAKTSFGGNTNISVPSIILGSGHTVAQLHGVPCLVIPCHTEAGDFAVEVNIKPMVATRPVQRS